jgi:L-lysine exporter family protein LysE/ArgO
VAFITAFLEGALFSFSLCFDLGMVNVAIMKTGIERGFKPSFMIGFGSCFGDLLYLTLALLGVSIILDIPVIHWFMWSIGSLFLLYLTFKMLWETWHPKSMNAGEQWVEGRTLLKDFLTGIGLAIASPTSIAWFALIAGPIVAGMKINEGTILFPFTAGFFAAGLAWSVVVAAISSLTGTLFNASITRLLSFVSALLYLYFALKILFQGI